MTAATGARPVVISPFANERVREWPIRHYRGFIERVRRDEGAPVVVVGTRPQRARANEVVRGFPYPEVMNTCGLLSWNELVALIDRARYVVANNSGIAHLAAARGVWTLCLFSGSHSFVEWMPRGPRVILATRITACSPCAVGAQSCPHAVACMADLMPDAAFDLAREMRSQERSERSARAIPS